MLRMQPEPPPPALPLAPLEQLPPDTRLRIPGLGLGNYLRAEQRGKVLKQVEHLVRLDRGGGRVVQLRGHKRAGAWDVVRAPLTVRNGLQAGADGGLAAAAGVHTVGVGPGMTVRQLLLLLGEVCQVPAYCQRLVHVGDPGVLLPTAGNPAALLSSVGIHPGSELLLSAVAWGADAEAALRGLARTSEAWGARWTAADGWSNDGWAGSLPGFEDSLLRAAAGYEASGGRLDLRGQRWPAGFAADSPTRQIIGGMPGRQEPFGYWPAENALSELPGLFPRLTELFLGRPGTPAALPLPRQAVGLHGGGAEADGEEADDGGEPQAQREPPAPMAAGPSAMLLEPLARLRKRLPAARCVVLGTEVSAEQLDRLVAEAKATNGAADLSVWHRLSAAGLAELPAVLSAAGVPVGAVRLHFGQGQLARPRGLTADAIDRLKAALGGGRCVHLGLELHRATIERLAAECAAGLGLRLAGEGCDMLTSLGLAELAAWFPAPAALEVRPEAFGPRAAEEFDAAATRHVPTAACDQALHEKRQAEWQQWTRRVRAVAPDFAALLGPQVLGPGWAGPGWMACDGPAGGFGELQHFRGARLALSASRRLETDCTPPVGWRWARRNELEPLMTGRREPYVTYGSSFELGGDETDLSSLCFLFADSLEVGGYVVRLQPHSKLPSMVHARPFCG
eukprot:SAG22_NODE_1763_length_3628_cov_1.648243_4_plen_679_part_00